MNLRQINSQLQNKVRKYLDYVEKKQRESPDKGSEILELISKKIKDEVHQEYFGKIINQMKIFRFNFSAECRE